MGIGRLMTLNFQGNKITLKISILNLARFRTLTSAFVKETQRKLRTSPNIHRVNSECGWISVCRDNFLLHINAYAHIEIICYIILRRYANRRSLMSLNI